jgi:hypothetical protein
MKQLFFTYTDHADGIRHCVVYRRIQDGSWIRHCWKAYQQDFDTEYETRVEWTA